MATDTKTENVILKGNELIHENTEGEKTLIATYDRKSGHLEWVARAFADKQMKRVSAAIGSVDKGAKVSGLTIVSMSVKGEERDKPVGKVPPKPKRDLIFGDQTPALVRWYFDYYPHEAYLRYGVFLDVNGEPVRRRVRRKTTELVDDRNGDKGLEDQNDGKGAQVGPKRWEKGPIGMVAEVETLDNQMIARRATCMTFAPIEVLGGFDTGDDEQEQTEGGESNE